MVKMEKRKSFVFFLDWQKVLKKYSVSLRCKVYDAICEYQESGEVPKNLEGEAMMAFNFIKKDMDRNEEKYRKVCERRKENVLKRWNKTKGTDTNVCKSKNSIQKNKVNTTITDNDNGNDNDIIDNDNSINNNNITTTTTKNKKKVFEIFLKDENKSISEKEFLNEIKGGGGEGLYDEFGGPAGVEKLFHQIMRDWEKRGAGEHESYVNALCHLTSQMRIQNNINNRKAKKNGNTKSKSKAAAAAGGGDNGAQSVVGALPQGGYAQSGKELEF